MKAQLNGWFGRFIKKAITKIAGLIDSTLNTATYGISSEIGSFEQWADEIGSQSEGGFWNRTIETDFSAIENDPRANYEPTFDEEILLNKFSEEFAKVVSNVNQMLINPSQLTSQEKITQVNKTLERIAIVKGYYKKNELLGLSKQAIDLRNLIIEVLFLKVESVLDSHLSGINVDRNINAIVLKPGKAFLWALQPLQKQVSYEFSAEYITYYKSSAISLDNPPLENNQGTTTTTENTTNKGISPVVKVGGIALITLLLAKLIRK